MAVDACETVGVSWSACIRVVLPQTGPPQSSILQAAVAAATGNGVDTILSVCGAAEVYRSAGGSCPTVAVVTATSNRGIIQVNVVETVSPGKALGLRHVPIIIPEASVTLAATPHVVRSL